jgi:hypothetical protein
MKIEHNTFCFTPQIITGIKVMFNDKNIGNFVSVIFKEKPQ